LTSALACSAALLFFGGPGGTVGGVFPDTLARDSSREEAGLLEEVLAIDPEDNSASYLDDLADAALDTIPLLPRQRRTPAVSVSFAAASAFQQGSDPPNYRGSPLKSLFSTRLRPSPNLSLGLLAEKDAGEPLELGFLSGHLEALSLPLDSRMVAGDYLVDAGCGLILSGELSGTHHHRARQGASALRPYARRNEYSFLRGIAWEMPASRGFPVRTLLFFSRRSLSSYDERVFPNTSGLFRSDGEIRGRGRIGESLLGTRLDALPSAELQLGLTLLEARFSPALEGRATGEPSGERLLLAGIDLSYVSGSLDLAGEVAGPGGLACALRALLPLAPGSHLALEFFSTAPGFTNHRFGGRPRSEGSSGFSVEITFPLTSWFIFRSTLEEEWSPGPAGKGEKTAFRAGWNLVLASSASLSLDLRWRRFEEEHPMEGISGALTRAVLDVDRRTLGFQLRLELARSLGILSRGELLLRSLPALALTERGEALREEVQWRPAPCFSLSAHLLLYSSASAETRLSFLEKDAVSRSLWQTLTGEGEAWGAVLALRRGTWRLWLYWSHLMANEENGAEHESGGLRLEWEWI
jgi:hypothetical protein